MERPLAILDGLEEVGDGGQLDVLVLVAAEDVEEVLGVQELLGDDGVRLAVGAHLDGTGIGTHHVDDTQKNGRSRVRSVELELVHVQLDEVKLGLQIVAEANNLGTALALPLVTDLVQLLRR